MCRYVPHSSFEVPYLLLVSGIRFQGLFMFSAFVISLLLSRYRCILLQVCSANSCVYWIILLKVFAFRRTYTKKPYPLPCYFLCKHMLLTTKARINRPIAILIPSLLPSHACVMVQIGSHVLDDQFVLRGNIYPGVAGCSINLYLRRLTVYAKHSDRSESLCNVE